MHGRNFVAGAIDNNTLTGKGIIIYAGAEVLSCEPNPASSHRRLSTNFDSEIIRSVTPWIANNHSIYGHTRQRATTGTICCGYLVSMGIDQ